MWKERAECFCSYVQCLNLFQLFTKVVCLVKSLQTLLTSPPTSPASPSYPSLPSQSFHVASCVLFCPQRPSLLPVPFPLFCPQRPLPVLNAQEAHSFCFTVSNFASSFILRGLQVKISGRQKSKVDKPVRKLEPLRY